MVKRFFSREKLGPTDRHRTMLLGLMIVFFLLWLVMPLVLPQSEPTIRLLTMPFRYLGVFVHEMGHGLFTLISGGHFYWFQLDLNGGVAVTAGGLRGVTLLGGLLGPGLLGASLLIASTRGRYLDAIYFGLVGFFALGIYYMVKPLFLSSAAVPEVTNWGLSYLLGIIVPGSAAALTLFVRTGGEGLRRFYLQLLGMLMCYSAFSDTHYIFRYEELGNGLFSDARVFASLCWPGGVEDVPWFVFLMVASLIALANFSLLGWGGYRALKTDPQKLPTAAPVDPEPHESLLG